MGYYTTFNGGFRITPELSNDHLDYLERFTNSRRMARKLGPEYGIEGEFYVDGASNHNIMVDDETIIDINTPPKTQPGLWQTWDIKRDRVDCEEERKAYYFIDWLSYLINNFFAPWGYNLNGNVDWSGEDSDDVGNIRIVNNIIHASKYELVQGSEDTIQVTTKPQLNEKIFKKKEV